MIDYEKSREFHEGFSVELLGEALNRHEHRIRRGVFGLKRLYLEPLHEVLVRIGDGGEFSTWYPVSYFSGAGVDGPSLGQPLRKTLQLGQALVIEFHNVSYQAVTVRGVFYGKEMY